ncbi:TIGR02679 domain-containing protein [Nocardia sp. NPDC058666]|uniref:TIGR02679 domain-containing protein n=1 Tax=Nocardia sp. NPDC058666 TaxID=3346587 RepID=UPI003657E232
MADREPPDGLREWAALAGPQRVLHAVRRRVHRGGQLSSGPLKVELSAEQRRQVARLLGTKWEVSGRAVTVTALGQALSEHGFGIAEFVEMLDGAPLPVRREVAAAEQAIVAAEQQLALTTLRTAGLSEPIVEAWLASPASPRAGTGACADLAEQIARVWPLLPWAGQGKRLGQVAAEATNNAHALDYDTELGRAVARLIAATAGTARPNRPGREWRAAWLSAGVRCDTVSSRVLTLNLPLDITARARPGVPVWLTLRDMLGQWRFEPIPRQVFVCENPTVVEAAADELGPDCAPLICTDGIPALAAIDLLTGTAEAGVAVRTRADVDRAGFVIVSAVRSAAPDAELWRFDPVTYAGHFGVAAPEAATLRQLWERHGRDLHEEAILGLLLDDLRCG